MLGEWEKCSILINMIRTLFLFAGLAFFACSDDPSNGDFLDGSDYDVSEKEDCNGADYNPKIQFCSGEIAKDKAEFIDERDGKKYKYTEIGTQVWMAENLNYEIAGSRCYDNDSTNCEKCGKLYNWFTATTKEICPEGWRLPNNDDWNTLERTVGGYKEATTKLTARSGWKNCSSLGYDCTDDYGFSALACGCALYSRYGYNFNNLGSGGYFWSSTKNASYDDLAYDYSPGSLHFDGNKQSLYSVRCIRD